jgi:hypothetical protein
MNLGNAILSIPSNMLFNDRDLYNLFVVLDLARDAKPADVRKELDKIVYAETDCGAHLDKFDPIGFKVTCIVEGSPAEFEERFDYPFPSHGLGEYLCDLEARVDDAFQDANQG